MHLFKYGVRILIVGLVIGAAFIGVRYAQNFFESRQSEWDEKITALNSALQFVKTNADQAVHTQTKQMHALEQRLSSLALSVKTGSGDSEESKALLKLILSTHHDLDIVIQALMAEQMLQGSPQKLSWVLNLERLSPQDKLNFQRMLDKRTSWKDVLNAINERLEKNQPIVLWGIANKLGIRVENAMSDETEMLEDLKSQVQEHNYDVVCERMLNFSPDDPILKKIEEVCSADAVISQYWKNLAD